MAARLLPSVHPAFALLSYGRPAGPLLPTGPLRRMGEGITVLGEPVEIATTALPAGQWVSHLPLWGNPLLQLERTAGERSVTWLVPAEQALAQAQVHGFSEWMALPGLHTLGDLVLLFQILERESRTALAARQRLSGPSLTPPISNKALWVIFGANPPILPRGHRLDLLLKRWAPGEVGGGAPLTAVQAMLRAIPERFRSRVPFLPGGELGHLGRGRQPDLAATAEAIGIVLGRLGWPGVALMDETVQGAGGRPFHPLTVKAATNLQLRDAFAAQRAARAAYVNSAIATGGGPSGAVPVDPTLALRDLERGLKTLWRTPWDNVHKEPLWRLSVNGVRNAGGHDLCPSHPCPCGFTGPPGYPGHLSDQEASLEWRIHHFWKCPVAAAIVEAIRGQIPGGGAIACADIWLLRPPQGVSHLGVWGVVAAAAIAAMHYGRKNLIRLHLGREELRGAGQTLITSFFPHISGPSQPTVLQCATRGAVAWFWVLLQDFAFLNPTIPRGWGNGPPADHPFLATDAASPQAQIVVRHS